MKRLIAMILSLAVGVTAWGGRSHDSVVWAKIKGYTAHLPFVGYINPHSSSLNEASWWSVGCETLDRDFANFENYKPYLGQTGVGYARLQSGWEKCEQKKGKYDFAWLDSIVDGVLEQGVHPWMCLCYGNKLYSGDSNLGAAIFSEGETMDAWVRYVKAVVKRYKGKVKMYEVWNEPERDEHPELYGVLFARTAKAIREVDPDVKIAAFGAISPEHTYIMKAMETIAKEGAVKYIDYVTYHAYWPTPERITPYVIKMQKEMQNYSSSIKLLQGESGCPSQLEYGHGLYGFEWTELSQSKWDCRNMLNHFGMGIPYSVFTMVDLNYGWMLQSYGLLRMNLRSEVQYKRPKFFMVRNVTSVFNHSVRAREDNDIYVNSSRQVRKYALEKNGKSIGFALWFCDGIPSNGLEREQVNVTVGDFGLKNPVYVDLITGTVHSLNTIIADQAFPNPEAAPENKQYPLTCAFEGLPVWDAPIVVMERSELDITTTDPAPITTNPFWSTRDFD